MSNMRGGKRLSGYSFWDSYGINTAAHKALKIKTSGRVRPLPLIVLNRLCVKR